MSVKAKSGLNHRDLVLIYGENNTSNIAADEILCFLTVRNEYLRLPSVLEHHRKLGVSRFFIVDNCSTDGTVDFLTQQPEVALFKTEKSFAESGFGMGWLHPLLDEFGHDHWSLTIDGDELFTYPYFEEANLRKFCRYLDKNKHQAVFSILLDMYSVKPISQTVHQRSKSLLSTCNYFDPGPYQMIRGSPSFPHLELRGGPRRRIFWDPHTPFFPPTVSKVPLVKWKRGYRYVSTTHYMFPGPNQLSDVTGALLHFKFLSDFPSNVKTEVERGEHFQGAREYKEYLKALESNPSITLYFTGSVLYSDSQTLIGLQLTRTSNEWNGFRNH